jgi:hypothetical protein
LSHADLKGDEIRPFHSSAQRRAITQGAPVWGMLKPN